MIEKLEVDSVILAYNSKVILQDVYLKSEIGKVTGILGRNGCGKSSLLKIIYGEILNIDKSVRINGKTLLGSFRSPKDLQYLPQENFIPKNLRLKRVFKDFDLSYSEFFNLFPTYQNYFNTKVGNLSSGQTRLIELYIILKSKTKFCLLDEPFSHIMPKHVSEIQKLINREKVNKGIIITDHMYKNVLDISDELYLISNGKTHKIKELKELEHLGYLRMKNDIAAYESRQP